MRSHERRVWLELKLPLAMVAITLASGCTREDASRTQALAASSGTATVSSTLALTSDDHHLWVVNADADSVSVLDTQRRALVQEILLASAPPRVDPVTRRFEPSVEPRALAILNDARVYVAGHAASRVYVIDAATHRVLTSVPVPAGPTGVVASPSGDAVYVISHEAGRVTQIDPATNTVLASIEVSERPFGAAVSADGRWLYVTHPLRDPGVTVIDRQTRSVRNKVPLTVEPRSAPFDKRIPNGDVRASAAITPRPGSGELWVPHLLLASQTPQPELDFESTAFPTISTLTPDGRAEGRRLLYQPPGVPGAKGAFSFYVAGPRAVAFTPDGKLALVALEQSEDVMVLDAETGKGISLVRPVPSALLEGIVINRAGTYAYVDGRNTHDVTVLAIDASRVLAPASVDGAPIERLRSDPMPAELRRGQRLFHSANSAAFPITKNFQMACTTCHWDRATDGLIWLFKDGPRDTSSNAGGPINTGFLMKQGLRATMQQYTETINVEQGGDFSMDNPAQRPDVEALAAYVNYAVPFPPNPYRLADGTLNERQRRGEALFAQRCQSCHSGPFFTDSGAGNPGLDLNKNVVLHDIGTCVKTGLYPDKPARDVLGNPRDPCAFDTPTLRGVFATAPYFHDGSAATLRDVVDRLPFSADLSESDKVDLVEYVKTL